MIRINMTGIGAASRDLSVTANNLANARTAGFKRSMAQFIEARSESLDARPGSDGGVGTRVDDVRRTLQQGSLDSTDKALDIAINGGGYFVYGDPKAQTGSDQNFTYSRAGSLTISANGSLTDASGAPLMGLPNGVGAGGTPQPINLAAAAGGNLSSIQTIGIDTRGTVSVQLADGRNVKVASVALASFRNEMGLKQIGGSALAETDSSGAPEFSKPSYNGMGEIKQGALEGTNVDLTNEMLHMIQAQQAYNGNARALQTSSEMLRSATETLTR
jgi:flagellar hook protein FlgE